MLIPKKLCASESNAYASNLWNMNEYPHRLCCRYSFDDIGIWLLEELIVALDKQGAMIAIQGKQGVRIAIVTTSV